MISWLHEDLMHRIGKKLNRVMDQLPWPKSPARALGCALLIGLLLAVLALGSTAYVQEGLPPTWPRTALLCTITPACIVGIGRLGWTGLLLFSVPSWFAIVPGVIGLVLIRSSDDAMEVAFKWLDASWYLMAALAVWGVLLAIRGWRDYFRASGQE